jgi:hypothetical protein
MDDTITQGGPMQIQATSGNANTNLSVVSSLKTVQSDAAQEALETAAVTKAEATKGDHQAIRKLAAQQIQNPAPAVVSPEGAGKAINLTA